MSKRNERLRALVSERLSAAAEEIFELVERTIKEYEEELSRSKEENKRSALLPEENQRRSQLLEENQRRSLLLEENQRRPQLLEENQRRPQLQNEEVQTLSWKKDVLVQPLMKESTSAPHLEGSHFSFMPDLTVKAEERSDLFEQLQPEPQEPIPVDDRLELYCLKSEKAEQINISDSDGDWETPASCSTQQMETDIDPAEYHDSALNEAMSDGNKDKAETHECLACGEVFAENAELQRHMALHVGVKPFSCPVCSKEFTRKNDFELHLTVHTGDAPFKCPECDACFALKSHLDSHMKGHRAAPLSCPVCKKSFTRRYRLHSHMAAHTGVRPFSCPVCGRGFTRKDNLGTHMAMHNGKPFICAICSRCFVRKDRLTAHMASHTGETFCLK